MGDASRPRRGDRLENLDERVLGPCMVKPGPD